MSNSLFETAVGAGVIAVAGLFLAHAYTFSSKGTASGYEVTAKFGRIDGVNVGTDVRLSGIKVGTVAGLSLDKKTYQAVATLSLEADVKVPDDSTLKVASEGLLGGNYLAIEPGGSDDNLKPGGQIQFTQGSVDLVGLIGQAMFGAGQAGKSPASPPAGGGTNP